MSPEKEKLLLTAFPTLYVQHGWSMQETCMCWGFNCDDGWFDIIFNLSKKLMEVDPDVQAVQVKEKFGGLRFYVGPSNEEAFDLIQAAEEESFHTCECCGTKENVSTKSHKGGHWIYTYCETCRAKREAKE